MKTIFITLLAAILCTAAFAEKTILSVWFELQIDGEAFVCTTQIEGREDKSRAYGPILVFPVVLKDHCTVGLQGGAFFFAASGSARIPSPAEPWFIQFRDLRIQAKQGLLYVVRAEGSEFRLQSVPFSSNPDAPGPTLKDQVLAALQ